MRAKPYTGIGSRETPPEILTILRSLGGALARRGYRLRSGAADGADSAIEQGAFEAGGKSEIFLPWKGFNLSLDGIDAQSLPTFARACELAEGFHPNWSRLKPPVRALMGRNAMQVLGSDLESPSLFLVCWAPNPIIDLYGELADTGGGTGLAVRMAHAHGIPRFHLGLPEHAQRIERFCDGNLPVCMTAGQLPHD